MALTPQNNDAFFREVDDEVRRERLQGLARRYGLLVMGVIVLALAALAAVLLWRDHRDAVAGAEGERFTAAMSSLSSGNGAQAGTQLDAIVKGGDKGYAPLARLLQADMLVQQGKPADAAARFLVIARDEAVPRPLRDLALVRATATGFDTLAPSEVIDRLKPLAIGGGPWFGSAGEMTGIAYLKLGQPRQAGKIFAAVAQDKTVPQTIRARAAQLAADVGVDVVQAADTPRS
ncbi:MAG TPA: tetratricopeptide repeat protein [Sphingomonas sp.]